MHASTEWYSQARLRRPYTVAGRYEHSLIPQKHNAQMLDPCTILFLFPRVPVGLADF